MSDAKDLLIRLLVDDDELGKVDGAEKKFDGFSKGAMVAGGAAATALTVGFLGAMDAEETGAIAAASLGLTPAESSRMGGIAGELYADAYGDSLEEVQGAVSAVTSSVAGMRDASSTDIQALTGDVLNFAKVFEIDVPRSAQVAGQMVTQGLASSAAEGLDLLTVTLQKVPEALRGDVVDAVDEYGGFFTQMGISGSDAMSMLAAASADGMYGIDKTGDAIKEFSIRSTDMSKSTTGVYEMLGLNAQEYSNMLLAGGETASDAFNTIVLGLQRIDDPASRANAAIALFGTPLEDLGTDGIPAFLASLQGVPGGLGEVEGAMDRVGDLVGGTAASAWDTFQRSASKSLQDIAAVALPVVQPLLAMMSEFAPILGPAVVVIGAVAGAVLLVQGAQAAFAAVQTVQTAAQWANNAAWLASPVTWIILAVVVAIGLLVAAALWLWANWDDVTKWIGEAWTNSMNGIQTGGKAVMDFVTGIPGAMWKTFEGAGRGILELGHGLATAFAWLWNNTIGAIDLKLPGFLGFPGINLKGPQIVVPALAAGGIVTGPTLALIGEAGPEAVLPLSQGAAYGLGGDGGVTHVVLNLDGRAFYEAMVKQERKRR